MDNNISKEVYSIQTKNLTKRFKKKKHRGFFNFIQKNRKSKNKKEKNNVTLALNKINLQIRPGELFGLLGPNGSGKTTMIKCLSTILIPDEGTIRVNGYDVSKETSRVRASLGMVVGGERTLYWKLTARDNLRYFASLYKIQRKYAKKRVEELLEMFQLSDRADERLEDYSTGMRQKVTIARALLHDPPILLLDEPTLGLDPGFSRQIREQIKELTKNQGKTVLLTTHYMDEADQLCDRVAFISTGNIVAIDTPNNLKSMIKEKEIVEISVYKPPANIDDQIRSLIPNLEVIKLIQGNDKEGNPSKIKIIGETAEEKIGEIIDLLRQKKAQISSINIRAPTLEDVFIKLTDSKLIEGRKK
ncbi:ABC transporter ATP-binding protein [Candidatus Bathyarchaeota archaeon]|nr:ABC transporter ATP-binding protein [Candidatus Bathyarchaeota archaeon]